MIKVEKSMSSFFSSLLNPPKILSGPSMNESIKLKQIVFH